jgi:hypothetical protein
MGGDSEGSAKRASQARELPRRSGGRAFWGVWISLLLAGVALAIAVRGAGPLPGDLALARLIQHPQLDGITGLVVHADDALWVLAPVAVLVALVRRRWLPSSSLWPLLRGG